jgi:SAM-dependent methyltransferase
MVEGPPTGGPPARDAADERALSFGSIAEEYDRHRPEPPDAAIGWLLPAPGASVIEVGAGTGALTRRVAPRAAQVTAIEPDPRMATVLRRRAPEAKVVVARGEHLPLPSWRADSLLAQSSWHWVEQYLGFGEAARVLRSGGVMGLLWVGPDRSVPWVAQLMNGGRVVDPETRRRQEEERQLRHHPELPPGLPFGEPVVRHFEGTRQSTSEDLVGLPLTYSPAIALDPVNGVRLRDNVARFVESALDLEGGTIELPLRCIVWRATRR